MHNFSRVDKFDPTSNLPHNETALLVIAEARPDQGQQVHFTKFEEQIDVLVILTKLDVVEFHHIGMGSKIVKDWDLTQGSLRIDHVGECVVDLFDGYSRAVSFVDGLVDCPIVASSHLLNQLEL